MIAALTLAGCATSNPATRAPNGSSAVLAKTQSQITSHEPKITLFDSVTRIEQYLKTEAKQDYSDKYLHSVRHHFADGHPRKGACWIYSFAFKTPRLGGDVSVYHFMDGEIIEFYHGP
jgi:hypothetical protein